MGAPATIVAYTCPSCQWQGSIGGEHLNLLRWHAKELRVVGSFTCVVDERMLCERCRPSPEPGDTDLRGHNLERDPGLRIEVAHVRRPVRRVIWLRGWDVDGFALLLLGRREGPRDPAATTPRNPRRLERWCDELQAEVDGTEPDLGHELGAKPRLLDFGALGGEPIARTVHLLNPTDIPAVFHFQGNLLTSAPGPSARPPFFPYRIALTAEVLAAGRAHASFEVAPRSRLAVDVLAQPWAGEETYRRFEIWVTPQDADKLYIGMIQCVHRP